MLKKNYIKKTVPLKFEDDFSFLLSTQEWRNWLQIKRVFIENPITQKGVVLMRIVRLKVDHFRGIESCDFLFPDNTRIACFIGAGDSTKTTLFRAIEWALWPNWNINVADTDFYNGDLTKPIKIEVTVTEIPVFLLSEEKFGLYLRKNLIDNTGNDEPAEGESPCLSIQLSIGEDLEPHWSVICNRLDPKPISTRDRQSMSFGSVGENCGRDLVWGRYSALQKYGTAQVPIKEALLTTLRETASHSELRELNVVSEQVLDVGRRYGVSFEGEVISRLIMNSGSISSSAALFDNNVPLRQKGTGSQRLLSMGLNINAFEDGTVLLVDEIETGLEPFRLRSLINEFRSTHEDNGQVLMTTHSPVVVAECSVNELLIVHSNSGRTSVFSLLDEENIDVMQRIIRTNPESFLSKRIIVCEGKTEVGFIRALDDYLSNTDNFRMAYEGVTTANGSGSDVLTTAQKLMGCGYDVCVFMDSDREDQESEKNIACKKYDIPIYSWATGNSIEEQIFCDSCNTMLKNLLSVAIEDKGIQRIKTKLQDLSFVKIEDTIEIKSTTKTQRKQLGTIAKKENWYKRIGLGQEIGNIVFSHWSELDSKTNLKQTVDALVDWIRKK